MPALAETNTASQTSNTEGGEGSWVHGMGMMHKAPGVFGTVASISGNNITVTGTIGLHGKDASNTTTTYTVDATNATVMKGGAASTVSAITVGDTVMIQGTVTGSNIVATTIRDGIPTIGKGKDSQENAGDEGQKTPPVSIIKGNGQPIVGGNVTAISGSTVTVTNKSNITYTVNATNAIIEKANATSTLANIAVGDSVVVQGTVNGTSITASSVLDQGIPASASGNPASPRPRGFMGFFSGIGGFFAHFFGF
jgi:hypothetical protein